jgi:hypothetical protein
MALAGGAIVVAAFRVGISLPLLVGSLRAVKTGLTYISASVPNVVDSMVDWLEAAYGGPINSR